MSVVGIDTGSNGAIATERLGGVQVALMPWVQNVGVQTDQIPRLIHPGDDVFIEEIQVRLGQGLKQAASMGVEFGRLLECLKTIGARVHRVPANRWKQAMGLVEKVRRVKGQKKEPRPVYAKGSPEAKAQGRQDRAKMKLRKNASVAMAQAMFPGVCLLPTPKCTKPHDGMAEALLLLEYGRRQLAGGR